jgi:hypothetical protein
MRAPMIRFLKHGSMLDDAPWTWQSSWNADMPDFFQGMPNGVYDNIYEDLDDSPVSWHITEVFAPSRHPRAMRDHSKRCGAAARAVVRLASRPNDWGPKVLFRGWRCTVEQWTCGV